MRFTTDPKYFDCGNSDIMYIDAAEVLCHVEVGNKINIEDGPLSFIVRNTGKDIRRKITKSNVHLVSHEEVCCIFIIVISLSM